MVPHCVHCVCNTALYKVSICSFIRALLWSNIPVVKRPQRYVKIPTAASKNFTKENTFMFNIKLKTALVSIDIQILQHYLSLKAQTALNNCVLGNTTILAENPNEWETNAILQQMSSQQGGSSNAWRGSGKQPGSGADTWSTGWPSNASASLWGSAGLDSAEQARATPSSLNSFLPGDLLGGESM